jgi:hypothetical protein
VYTSIHSIEICLICALDRLHRIYGIFWICLDLKETWNHYYTPCITNVHLGGSGSVNAPFLLKGYHPLTSGNSTVMTRAGATGPQF